MIIVAASRKKGRKDGGKNEGGGVVASQLEKDWITALRKVSANTNSPWSHGGVLSEHPHLPPPPPPLPDSIHRIYTPAQTKAGLHLTIWTLDHLLTSILEHSSRLLEQVFKRNSNPQGEYKSFTVNNTFCG